MREGGRVISVGRGRERGTRAIVLDAAVQQDEGGARRARARAHKSAVAARERINRRVRGAREKQRHGQLTPTSTLTSTP